MLSTLKMTSMASVNDERLKELDEKENKLAGLLKVECDKDLERDAGIFRELGDVYHQKAKVGQIPSDVVKAAALYNAAILRTKNEAFKQELIQCLKVNEIAFCKALNLSFDEKDLPCSHTLTSKARLIQIRDNTDEKSKSILEEIKRDLRMGDSDDKRIGVEENFISRVKCLFEYLTADLKEFISDLLSRCMKLLGKPPEKYAIISLGSLSRSESTPYSDIEWAVLINNEKDKEYFRKLTYMMHLFVVNIGESKMRGIAIKSLNDFDEPGGNWFVDTVTRSGFQFDSAAPWACHNPTGRPDRPTKVGIEFIQTPETLASFSELEFANDEGYDIGRVLSTISKICGSDDGDELITRYKQALSKILKKPVVMNSKRREITDLINRYEEKLIHRRNIDDIVLNIKEDLYRLPSLVINVLKTMNDVQRG